MLELLNTLLVELKNQEEFQNKIELKLEKLSVENMEEKLDVILAKLPILERRTMDIPTLRREWGNKEENFKDCVDKLLKEVDQLRLKVAELEWKLENNQRKGTSGTGLASSSSPASGPKISNMENGNGPKNAGGSMSYSQALTKSTDGSTAQGSVSEMDKTSRVASSTPRRSPEKNTNDNFWPPPSPSCNQGRSHIISELTSAIEAMTNERATSATPQYEAHSASFPCRSPFPAGETGRTPPSTPTVPNGDNNVQLPEATPPPGIAEPVILVLRKQKKGIEGAESSQSWTTTMKSNPKPTSKSKRKEKSATVPLAEAMTPIIHHDLPELNLDLFFDGDLTQPSFLEGDAANVSAAQQQQQQQANMPVPEPYPGPLPTQVRNHLVSHAPVTLTTSPTTLDSPVVGSPSLNQSGNVTHEMGSSPGQLHQFPCVCGLEFPCEGSLATHIRQKTLDELVGTSSFLEASKEKNRGSNQHGKDPSQPNHCLCGKKLKTDRTLTRHINRFQTGSSGSNQNAAKRSRKARPSQRKSAPNKNILRKHKFKFGPRSIISNATTALVRRGQPHGKDPSRKLHCLCGRNYQNNVRLYDHIRFYSGRNLLSCKYCRRNFVYGSMLKTHLKLKHNARFTLGCSHWKKLESKMKEDRKRKLTLQRGASSTVSTKGFHIKKEISEEESPKKNRSRLVYQHHEETVDDQQNDHFLQQHKNQPEVVEIDASGTRYCLCNQIGYGSMIGCDNWNCKQEWFHYGCVGITSDPPENTIWYCPQCLPVKREAMAEMNFSAICPNQYSQVNK